MGNINKAYSWAIQTCNAPKVGYSQTYRNQKTVGGVTYYDCSSFINYALIAGGFSTPNYAPTHNAFTTRSMATELLRLGFVEVDSTGVYMAGDIGLSGSHTEMCYKGGASKGIFMGAHTSNAKLVNQVSIGSSGGNPNYERSFPRLFRYGDSGAVEYGASVFVVSALAGNAWQESHVNPRCGIDRESAFGLFMWDGGRKSNLLEWLTANGYAKDSGVGQLKYLIVENEWQGSSHGISSLSEFLSSNSNDIPALTEAFCTCWERPGKPNLQNRIDFAEEVYYYIIENANNDSIKDWELEPVYYLSKEQAMKNAVMMYRELSSGGGGGGVVTNKTRKLPVWMMIRYVR